MSQDTKSPITIEDLLGFKEPLIRFIEVVSQGAGKLFGPYLCRKLADAKAYEIRTITNAIEEVGNNVMLKYEDSAVSAWKSTDDNQAEIGTIHSRSQERIELREQRRQKNIERIAESAALRFLEEQKVPEERPTEDWIFRFFDLAQDVSEEEMQKVWSRILTREIQEPGSFSLRAMESLKLLTKQDALYFELMSKFAICSTDTSFVAIPDDTWISSRRGVTDTVHIALAESNLMFPKPLWFKALTSQKQNCVLNHHGQGIKIIHTDQCNELSIQMWCFTAVGSQLLRLVENAPDVEYLAYVSRYCEFQGAKVEPINS